MVTKPKKPRTGSQALERVMRFRSVRSYREALGRLARAAWAGEISWSDFQKACSGMRICAEMLMAENLMDLQGLSDVEPTDAPLGAGGGLGRSVAPKTHVKKRVVTKRGYRGDQAVVEDRVQVEGGERDVGDGGSV